MSIKRYRDFKNEKYIEVDSGMFREILKDFAPTIPIEKKYDLFDFGYKLGMCYTNGLYMQAIMTSMPNPTGVVGESVKKLAHEKLEPDLKIAFEEIVKDCEGNPCRPVRYFGDIDDYTVKGVLGKKFARISFNNLLEIGFFEFIGRESDFRKNFNKIKKPGWEILDIIKNSDAEPQLKPKRNKIEKEIQKLCLQDLIILITETHKLPKFPTDMDEDEAQDKITYGEIENKPIEGFYWLPKWPKNIVQDLQAKINEIELRSNND